MTASSHFDLCFRERSGRSSCLPERALRPEPRGHLVPASNTARFLIFSGVIILFATVVIIATKGPLGGPADVVPVPEAGDAAGEHTPDDTAGRESDQRDA